MPSKYGFETAAERSERERQEVQARQSSLATARKDIEAKVRDILEDYVTGPLGLSIPMVVARNEGERTIWRAIGHRAVSAVSQPDSRQIDVALLWDDHAGSPRLEIVFQGAPLWPERDKLVGILEEVTGLAVSAR